ncbi:MAG: SCP2 sterol-binding domain-containing protein [Desulfatibacillum sp.]|nr:SCP2 sterol-binding domain-containing protein [Desulfatibacillum sp.]
MTNSMTLTLNLDVDELMTGFIPKVVREFMRHVNTSAQFQGTEMSLVVAISGREYSYVLKDGENLTAREGGLDAPMVRVALTLEDMEKLILMKNIDLFMGMPSDSVAQASKKRAAVEVVKGMVGLELTNDDGGVSKISVILNNVREPQAVFKLSMEHARQMMAGKMNPVSMFMSGQLKIEGDIGFAMALQPLFT